MASNGLTKRFRGGQVAVDRIDLAVPTGSVYGFLGPNGAGKTTTIRMLLGLIRPTAGTHGLLSQPMPARAADVLPHVGSLVEGPAFHPYLSGRDNLRRLDAADRHADPGTAKARIGAALDRVGLTAAAGKRYRNYSLGMRQRLGIAHALLGDPQILILDEPANGLDPAGIHWMRGLLREYADRGGTVMLSSHLLHEVQIIADELIVIGRGKIVAQGSKQDLLQSAGTFVKGHDPQALAAALERAGIQVVPSGDKGLRTDAPAEQIGLAAAASGVALVELRPADGAGLEEMFLELTSDTQRDDISAVPGAPQTAGVPT